MFFAKLIISCSIIQYHQDNKFKLLLGIILMRNNINYTKRLTTQDATPHLWRSWMRVIDRRGSYCKEAHAAFPPSKVVK